MTEELLKKINELSKKRKECGLTEEEEKLRKELHAEYLKQFRSSFKAQLNNVDVKLPDGKVIPLIKLPKKNK